MTEMSPAETVFFAALAKACALLPDCSFSLARNAFIYNMASHRWTLLRLGGSLSSKTTLYGIWQTGGIPARTTPSPAAPQRGGHSGGS